METHRPRMNERQVKYLTGLSSMVKPSFSTVESARAGVGACEENWDSVPGSSRVMKDPTPMMERPAQVWNGAGNRGEGEKERREMGEKKKERKEKNAGRGEKCHINMPSTENRLPPRGTMANRTGTRISRPTFVSGLGKGRFRLTPWAHTPYWRVLGVEKVEKGI